MHSSLLCTAGAQNSPQTRTNKSGLAGHANWAKKRPPQKKKTLRLIRMVRAIGGESCGSLWRAAIHPRYAPAVRTFARLPKYPGPTLRGWALIVLSGIFLFYSVRDGLVAQRIPFYGKSRSRLAAPRYVAQGQEAVLYGVLGCVVALACGAIGIDLVRGGSVPWRRGIGWPSE